MTTDIVLPEMGEGLIEGTLSRWLVKQGEHVEQFEPIAEVETDKVTTELTAEVAGTILELLVNEGETIAVNTVLARIDTPGEAKSAAHPPVNAESQTNGQGITVDESGVDETISQSSAHSKGYTGRISPLVGRIASEHKVDLGQVPGTGRDGRITKHDILAYIEQRDAADLSAISESIPGPVSDEASVTEHPKEKPEPQLSHSSLKDSDKIPMTPMRKAIAEHMVLSKQTSPHVTTVFEFDFSAVAAHRTQNKKTFAKDGANLTFTAYMVAATVQALKQHPLANSVWSDEGIILKREINIGMATAVSDGLTVPVIKNADSLNLLGLARVINELANRARNKQLDHSDLQDGTFTITNHGTSGSLFATPIINQPQAGILGIGLIEKRVKVINDALAIRPLAYASFTFDHRILDGATADAFVGTVKELIENWS
ncbi:MAG: dihydrolipoamide acetyltransferase family protein [Candidatus Promineifilaceae bacterium]|nr:dihydrolipoamide acetyltransferase family protein [Candidatus Promineifilaceae bacterium]